MLDLFTPSVGVLPVLSNVTPFEHLSPSETNDLYAPTLVTCQVGLMRDVVAVGTGEEGPPQPKQK